MEQIINQIYWDGVNDTYMPGTRFKKFSDKAIEFENNLMAPGHSIMTWTSTNNYQSSKAVPQLPILIKGHSYRIFIKGETEPANTFVNRLTFYDAQNDEIEHRGFTSLEYNFVFPENATSYKFEIVNAGCRKIRFKRLQIADEDLPKKIFDDIYFSEEINPNPKQTLNVILVMDNMHGRKIWSHLERFAGVSPMLVVNISWQGREKAGQVVKEWLAENKITKFRLISTNTKLNSLIPDIFIDRFNVEYYDNNSIRSKNPLMQKDTTWYSENICDPDWIAIEHFLKRKHMEAQDEFI